jgi:hypothetical protein
VAAPESDRVASQQATDLAGKRYGEVLLVQVGESGPQATVYNSFPLNDCPAEPCPRTTPRPSPPRTARSRRCSTARYWLMNAGEEIYELVDPDGRRWVMQTYSQVADPGLSRADLPGRAERLDLPAGWTYRPRMLTSELRVDTRSRPARVLQDNLTNSYSMETD